MPPKDKVAPARGSSKPTNAIVELAQRQALARLRKGFPQLTAEDRSDIVADAHVKCLATWTAERGVYEAWLTKTAERLATDRARTSKRRAAAVERSTVERPQTMAGLRKVVLEECRARVLRAMGGDEEWFARFFAKSVAAEVEEQRAGGKAARAVLKALKGAPAWVVERVDVNAMTRIAVLYNATLRQTRQVQGFNYRDAKGNWCDFGGVMGSDTDRAVLAILEGAWPKTAKPGQLTAADVIELEADAIRRAWGRSS